MQLKCMTMDVRSMMLYTIGLFLRWIALTGVHVLTVHAQEPLDSLPSIDTSPTLSTTNSTTTSLINISASDILGEAAFTVTNGGPVTQSTTITFSSPMTSTTSSSSISRSTTAQNSGTAAVLTSSSPTRSSNPATSNSPTIPDSPTTTNSPTSPSRPIMNSDDPSQGVDGPVSMVLNCSFETFSDETGTYNWPTTPSGLTASLTCPYGPRLLSNKNMATRHCSLSRSHHSKTQSQWATPLTSFCEFRSSLTSELYLLSKESITAENAEDIVRLVDDAYMNYSSNGVNVTSTDINLTAFNLLESISALDYVGISQPTLETAFSVLSNVSNAPQQSIDKGRKLYNSSSRLLVAADWYPARVQITNTSDSLLPLSFSTPHLSVLIFKLPSNQDSNSGDHDQYLHFSVPHGHGEIIRGLKSIRENYTLFSLPRNISEVSKDRMVRVEVVSFVRDNFFESEEVVSGNVVSINVTVDGEKVTNLNQPLTFWQPGKRYIKCAFWNFLLNDCYGGWDTTGCLQVQISTQIVCKCHHLTHFAILLSRHKIESQSHQEALKWITRFGCSLSILGLVFTVATVAISSQKGKQPQKGSGVTQKINGRKRKKTGLTAPMQILVHLCISLATTLIIILVAVQPGDDKDKCIAPAALLHYFLLTTFAWMLVEGIYMYNHLVRTLKNGLGFVVWKVAVIAWGLPAIVAGVTAAANLDSYRSSRSLRLCRIHGIAFEITLFGPICAILLFNFIIYGLVLRQLYKHFRMRHHRNLTTHHLSSSKKTQEVYRSLTFSMLLGLTWITGLFMIDSDGLALQYIFTILVSLQGFLLFIFQCASNPDVRQLWKSCIGTKREAMPMTSTGPSTVSHQREVAGFVYSNVELAAGVEGN